jgi:hypothetical protein
MSRPNITLTVALDHSTSITVTDDDVRIGNPAYAAQTAEHAIAGLAERVDRLLTAAYGPQRNSPDETRSPK